MLKRQVHENEDHTGGYSGIIVTYLVETKLKLGLEAQEVFHPLSYPPPSPPPPKKEKIFSLYYTITQNMIFYELTRTGSILMKLTFFLGRL